MLKKGEIIMANYNNKPEHKEAKKENGAKHEAKKAIKSEAEAAETGAKHMEKKGYGNGCC